MKKEEKAILEKREAIIELYKCGFLDGYIVWKKPRSNKEWETLNKDYRKAFVKRFEKKINKILKKKK